MTLAGSKKYCIDCLSSVLLVIDPRLAYFRVYSRHVHQQASHEGKDDDAGRNMQSTGRGVARAKRSG